MNPNKNPEVKLYVDVGIRLDDDFLGSGESWVAANEVLDRMAEELNLRETSAGTGFGVRDMQFYASPEQDREDVFVRVSDFLEQSGLDVSYIGIYWIDGQGYEVDSQGRRVDVGLDQYA